MYGVKSPVDFHFGNDGLTPIDCFIISFLEINLRVKVCLGTSVKGVPD